jgi:hypothetical protein
MGMVRSPKSGKDINDIACVIYIAPLRGIFFKPPMYKRTITKFLHYRGFTFPQCYGIPQKVVDKIF